MLNVLNQVKGFEQSGWSKQCKHAQHLKHLKWLEANEVKSLTNS